MSELISVIIPTFNRSGVLLRAIHSVLNQSYKHFELIVVDDGSTDETERLLKPFIENQSIQYVRQDNKGVSSARNRGVSHASGEWLAFLDSDDEWLEDKLLHQIKFLNENFHLKIVYSDEIWMRNGVRVNQKKIHQKKGGWIFAHCVAQCLIGPSSVLLSKNLFTEMKGFDESYEVCEDYDLWLKISSRYEVGLIETPLIVKYGGHEDQLSTKFFAMDMWRLRALKNILNDDILSEEFRVLIKETMKKKGDILISGYQKYGNHDAILEVRQLLHE
jgi:glycosyltransferase involved in cell wall biosynthesis